MKITNAGSAQTTGKPFDLRINDSGSSTNFFVVNNGTENVFTRDGCFYIDGAGTLCMDSTGYKLMGWLADKNTGEVITSGDVTALSIMDTPNLTSPPEATEMAYASGIIDKDTPDLSSTQGYTMALEFFDDLGYPYSARFTVRLNSDDGSAYTVKLSQILDQNGVDVLKEITEAQGITLDKVFGKASTATYSMDAGTPYETNEDINTLLAGTEWTYDTSGSANYAGGIIGHLYNTATKEGLYFNANGVFYADPEGKQAYQGATTWGDVFTKPDGSSTLIHPWSDTDKNTINISSSGKVSLVQIEGANTNNILKENWYFLDTVYDVIMTTAYEAISSAGVDFSSNVEDVTTYPVVPNDEVDFDIKVNTNYQRIADLSQVNLRDGSVYYNYTGTDYVDVTAENILTGAWDSIKDASGAVYDQNGNPLTTPAAALTVLTSGKDLYNKKPSEGGTVISDVTIVNDYVTATGANLCKQVRSAESLVTYYKDPTQAAAPTVSGDTIIDKALSKLGGTLYLSDGTHLTTHSSVLLALNDGKSIYKTYPIGPSDVPLTTADLVQAYKDKDGVTNLCNKEIVTTSKAVYYKDPTSTFPPTATAVPGDDIVASALTTLGTLYLSTGTEIKTVSDVLRALHAGNKLYADNPTTTPGAEEVTSTSIVEAYKTNSGVSTLYEKTVKKDVKRDAQGNPIPSSSGWPVKYGDYEYPNPAETNPAEMWGGYYINLSTNRLVAVTTSGTLYEYDDASGIYVASTMALDSMLKDFDPDTTKVEITDRNISATYTNYNLTFSKADGSFQGIDDQDSVYMFTSALGPNFHNVSIDFTALRNANNGKKSTAGMDSGTSATNTTGAGKKLGSLVGVAVQNDGRIYGSYDNGNTVLLGQIASAHFANASGLEKIGESCYNTTLNSGDAVIGDISADGSSMTSGEIEMSNVDLSAEFTDMITTQRGFQANSRVITTSDTLLEELINLKR